MNEGDIYTRLGSLIRDHRVRLAKTQSNIADETGLSRASIANIEKGRQRILLHQLYSLASSLGVEPFALLPLREQPNRGIDRPTLRSSIALSKKEEDEVAKLVNSLTPSVQGKDR